MVSTMSEIEVYETFVSIQGESSFAGMPCFFIRFSGCNLRCGYCDTEKARGRGSVVTVDSLVNEAIASGMPIIEITGGEPLIQDGFRGLAMRLQDESGKTVLVETNGTCDISAIPAGVIAVVDVKCPSSLEGGSFDMANIDRLRTDDEVKFVLSDKADYDWAKDFVFKNDLLAKCKTVHFSPVCNVLEPSQLAGWILDDGLGVRLQIQLHKILGWQ